MIVFREHRDWRSQKPEQSRQEPGRMHFVSKDMQLWRHALSFRWLQIEQVWLSFRSIMCPHFKWQNTFLISSSIILPEDLSDCIHELKIRMSTHKAWESKGKSLHEMYVLLQCYEGLWNQMLFLSHCLHEQHQWEVSTYSLITKCAPRRSKLRSSPMT